MRRVIARGILVALAIIISASLVLSVPAEISTLYIDRKSGLVSRETYKFLVFYSRENLGYPWGRKWTPPSPLQGPDRVVEISTVYAWASWNPLHEYNKKTEDEKGVRIYEMGKLLLNFPRKITESPQENNIRSLILFRISIWNSSSIYFDGIDLEKINEENRLHFQGK